MSIFKTKGFDTLIGKGTNFSGDIDIQGAVVIDGTFRGGYIRTASGGGKATLMVNGEAKVDTIILADDLTVCGSVKAEEIRIEGILAIKGEAKVNATTIYYRTLVIEPGAVINGQLKHLDHCSEGEEV